MPRTGSTGRRLSLSSIRADSSVRRRATRELELKSPSRKEVSL